MTDFPASASSQPGISQQPNYTPPATGGPQSQTAILGLKWNGSAWEPAISPLASFGVSIAEVNAAISAAIGAGEVLEALTAREKNTEYTGPAGKRTLVMVTVEWEVSAQAELDFFVGATNVGNVNTQALAAPVLASAAFLVPAGQKWHFTQPAGPAPKKVRTTYFAF
jgi:hypothetical protein